MRTTPADLTTRSTRFRALQVTAQLVMAVTLCGCSTPHAQVDSQGVATASDADQRAALGSLRRVSLDASTEPSEFREAKPTVVMFWSAWCGPSRDSLIDLAHLADQQDTDDWDFFGLTFNTPDVTAQAMRELGFDGCSRLAVCTDEYGKAFRAVRASGTPLAAVYGADGSLRAVVHPSDLSADALDSYRAGDDPRLAPSDAIADSVPDYAWDVRLLEDDPEAVPTVEINRVDERGNFARYAPENGFISVPGTTAGNLLASALNTPTERIIWDGIDEERNELYSVRIIPPDRSLDTSKRTLAQTICRECGWAWERSTERRESWVITRIPERTPTRSDAETARVSWMGPNFHGDATVRDLATWLESISQTPAVDRTGFGDELFSLRVEIRSFDDIEPAFAEHGLSVSMQDAEIEVIRVTRAE